MAGMSTNAERMRTGSAHEASAAKMTATAEVTTTAKVASAAEVAATTEVPTTAEVAAARVTIVGGRSIGRKHYAAAKRNNGGQCEH
jgi:hypothetical protein